MIDHSLSIIFLSQHRRRAAVDVLLSPALRPRLDTHRPRRVATLLELNFSIAVPVTSHVSDTLKTRCGTQPATGQHRPKVQRLCRRHGWQNTAAAQHRSPTELQPSLLLTPPSSQSLRSQPSHQGRSPAAHEDRPRFADRRGGSVRRRTTGISR